MNTLGVPPVGVPNTGVGGPVGVAKLALALKLNPPELAGVEAAEKSNPPLLFGVEGAALGVPPKLKVVPDFCAVVEPLKLKLPELLDCVVEAPKAADP